MDLSKNALTIYKNLYLDPSEVSPYETHRRIAKFAASAEKTEELQLEWEEIFLDALNMNNFRPNTPIMMNAGLREKPQTAACFVGSLEDDLDRILDFDRDAAKVYKFGSGIGGNYGILREKGAKLSSGGVSSGPLSYMEKIDATGIAVKSGGKSRRAAHMAMMDDNHPDVFDFSEYKNKNRGRLKTMNLSIAITDKFMNALGNDEDWNLIGVVDGKIKKTVKAKELFDHITKNAHEIADPGIWFIDRVNEDNTLPGVARIVSPNPCGEQPLLPRQACALASINLATMVTPAGLFDMAKFQRIASVVTRFMDNILDISGYPTPQYEEMALNTRPIGIGIMGFADALILMNLEYGSKKSRVFAEELAMALTKTVIFTSAKLAHEKGAFPLFNQGENRATTLAVANKFFNLRKLDDKRKWEEISECGLRNSSWTSIAPTGSISIACDCSQGMEPLFAISYTKELIDTGEILTMVNPIFEKLYSKEPWYETAIQKIIKNHGSCQQVDEIPNNVRQIFLVAHDINWHTRLLMQAGLQNGINTGISSTINLPQDTPAKTIGEIYKAAWKYRLKGVTIYRDGVYENQPVNFGSKKETEKSVKTSRPKVRSGKTHEVKTGHGKIYLTINSDESGNVIEIFTNGGKNGSVNSANLEAIARLFSIALQFDVPIDILADTIVNINDGTAMWETLSETDPKPQMITSIPDAIGKVIKRFYSKENQSPDTELKTSEKRCPDCGSQMYKKEGCDFCPQCGSKCS